MSVLADNAPDGPTGRLQPIIKSADMAQEVRRLFTAVARSGRPFSLTSLTLSVRLQMQDVAISVATDAMKVADAEEKDVRRASDLQYPFLLLDALSFRLSACVLPFSRDTAAHDSSNACRSPPTSSASSTGDTDRRGTSLSERVRSLPPLLPGMRSPSRHVRRLLTSLLSHGRRLRKLLHAR